MITGTLDEFPPSVNKLYKHFVMRKGGRQIVNRRLSSAAEKFKTRAGIALGRQWMFEDPLPQDKPLAANVVFYFPHLQNKGWPKHAKHRFKTQDVDNYLKLLLDVVKEAAGVDDNNIIDLHAIKREDEEHPRIEITLWELPDERYSEHYETGTAADSMEPA